MKTIEALAVLSALNTLGGQSLPLKFAYAAAKNRRKLAEFAEVYEAKRKELLDQFGEKGSDGQLEVKDGKVQLSDGDGFLRAFQALGEVDVDLSLHQLAIYDFPPSVDLEVMQALMPMVAEESAA